MDQSQLLVWSLMMTTQAERSRVAENQHLRAEQVRQARDEKSTVRSAVGRARRALSRTTRASAEPNVLATQP